MTQFDEPMDLAPMPEGRTSLLAVASLVLSLLCCVPGPGAIGALLGGIAMVVISRSRGRLRGMGLAIAGVIIGLIVTLVWIGVVVLVDQSVQKLADYDQAIAAIGADDQQALQAWLTPSVQTAITDEDIDAFRIAYEAAYGEFIGIPDNIIGVIKGYFADRQATQATHQLAVKAGYTDNIPAPALFDGGAAMVVFAIDPATQLPSGMPAIENIGVLAPDGSMIWLVDPKAPAP